jgi:hypothetical protein
MAIAPTADFDELIIEVEFTAGSGTYVSVCGMSDYTVTRTNSLGQSEVLDCADISLPAYIKKHVQSQDVTISGTGQWALTNHQQMYEWWSTGATKNVRVRNTMVTDNGTSGDTEIETIPMILENLSNERSKSAGVISASVQFSRNGATTVTELS